MKTAPFNKKGLAVVAVLLILAFASIAFAGDFRASRKSDKFHYPDCRFIRQILEPNLIKFSSPEEAFKAGYTPCKACKPPLKSTPASP